MASSPDIASCPPIVAAIFVFSASLKPAKPLRRSPMISFKDFMEPSLFVIEIPSSSIAIATSSVGLASLVIIDRRDVPACPALIPEFAISPIATAVSSAEKPSAPATGATYLNVSPIMLTFVLAFEEAAARTSAKCPDSFADIPNAVNASVTISEVTAKLSPDAAARSITPSMPESISSVFQPAIAIYSNALAASVALNFVFAPISFALSDSFSKSAPAAPEIADTFDIPASKSEPTLTA